MPKKKKEEEKEKEKLLVSWQQENPLAFCLTENQESS